MAIRRQLKNDPQSASMVGLLSDIRNNPTVLHRQWFRDLYSDSVVGHLADPTFDLFAGVGGPHVRSDLVDADITELKAAGERAVRYADRVIAHRDLRGVKDLPTYKELDDLVAQLERLLKQYVLMLRACELVSALPEVHHDWKAIFRVPWSGAGHPPN